MKHKWRLLPILIFVLALSLQLPAQSTAPRPEQTKTTDDKSTDVSITATVTARELKFETVPNPKVEFPGNPERITVWEADRENLPRPVEPGVTYRDIGIRLRITSRFADIERIVAEALGETPVTEDKTEPQQPAISPRTGNKREENTVKIVSQTPNSKPKKSN